MYTLVLGVLILNSPTGCLGYLVYVLQARSSVMLEERLTGSRIGVAAP